MIDFAKEFRVALPAWIDDELAGVPAVITGREERMRLVHRLADRNWREGDGGPFAALVAERDSGRIVSVGVNLVLTSGVSGAHAEVVALGLAQTDWAKQFETRGMEVVRDVLRDEALTVFRAYREAVDAGEVTVYNARESAA